jgi:hypothetical protein
VESGFKQGRPGPHPASSNLHPILPTERMASSSPAYSAQYLDKTAKFSFGFGFSSSIKLSSNIKYHHACHRQGRLIEGAPWQPKCLFKSWGTLVRLTLVILATWEAEISRTTVRNEPRQLVCRTLSQKNTSQKKKRAGGVAQGIGPEFKLQYHKKIKKRLGYL